MVNIPVDSSESPVSMKVKLMALVLCDYQLTIINPEGDVIAKHSGNNVNLWDDVYQLPTFEKENQYYLVVLFGVFISPPISYPVSVVIEFMKNSRIVGIRELEICELENDIGGNRAITFCIVSKVYVQKQ
jgi:hypothetical protein